MLALHLFGSLRGFLSDHEELGGRTAQRHRLAFLALLAAHRSGIHRDKILGYLWPESKEERGRHLLSNSVYVLRQAAGAETLLLNGDVYRLNEESVRCDLWDFESALERGDQEAAVTTYQAPFLDGFYLPDASEFEQWVESERDHLARKYARAVEALAEAAEGAGSHQSAVGWWRRLAAHDRHSSRVTLRLMRSLVASGDPGGALTHARIHASLLHDELGIEPDSEVTALVAKLRTEPVRQNVIGVAEPSTSSTSASQVNSASLRPPQAGIASPSNRAVGERREGDSKQIVTRGPEATISPREGLHETVGGGMDIQPTIAPIQGAEPLDESFEVIRQLGKGTVANVFLARERGLGRLVAIKILAEDAAFDEVARRRFEREAQSAGRIQHPYVTPIFRVGLFQSGVPFLVMPYITGGSFQDRLSASSRLPRSAARRYIRQISSGLAAAHRLGIIHRDVKPANILYERETDRAMLTDFGIAGVIESAVGDQLRLTRPGEMLGNPAYASPEQLRGEVVSERTDVYSLGIVAFELLTGRLPFDGDTGPQVMLAKVRGELQRLSAFVPDIDPDLDDLVFHCVSKFPEQRPFAADVEELLKSQLS